MSLEEYKPGTTFPGVIGLTIDQSSPAWPEPMRAREGMPNVLFIVLDDTGYGQLGCFGSPIETPNLDSLAEGGLRYTNMHTTALCSPSRSCKCWQIREAGKVWLKTDVQVGARAVAVLGDAYGCKPRC